MDLGAVRTVFSPGDLPARAGHTLYVVGPIDLSQELLEAQDMKRAGLGRPLEAADSALVFTCSLVHRLYSRLWSNNRVKLCWAGQEKQEVPGAGHTSCTVEMADLTQRYEVAVLDEIQVLAPALSPFPFWAMMLLIYRRTGVPRRSRTMWLCQTGPWGWGLLWRML